AEMLGGEIAINSEFRKGSTFIFSMPFKADNNIQDEQKEKSKSESVKMPKSSEKAVLIVEDDFSSFELIRIILKKKNHKVYHAHHGQEAIDVLKDKSEISLVLMDVKMPVMDGYEATAKIREFNKEIPIIAITAYALEGDREKAIKAGCNDYISKPVKKAHLLEVINKY
ncbi:MAG: response regulator, partial [Bacteroidales bacterium]|nr:response regulator [Bacteroidales bacterium]